MLRPLEEIADDFVAEFRGGHSPSVEGYVARYPAYAEEIRELFPTLVLLEQGGKREALSDLSSFGSKSSGSPSLTKLADYVIIREIGRGGMGVVYEAQDPTLDRRVALKVLRIFPGDEEQAIRRFHREAKMAAQLHHTNVVPVFGTGTVDDKFFYVMQYIRGTSLDQLLSEFNRLSQERTRDTSITERVEGLASSGNCESAKTDLGAGNSRSTDLTSRRSETDDSISSLTPRFSSPHGRTNRNWAGKGAAASAFAQLKDNPYLTPFPDLNTFVCQVGIQVSQALGYAHRHQILHRDIKPSNLLLDEGGTVWITDFGLAKPQTEDDLTREGQIIGTLRYMAPEGLEGDFLPESDLFSLGLTLYELVTLAPAFGETNYSRLLNQVSESHFVPPRKLDPSIPRDLETIILKATAKDVSKRYRKAEDLANDLQRFLDERPIKARRASLIEHAWRWTRRNMLSASLILLSSFLLCLLTSASMIGFVHSRMLLAQKETESRRAKTNLSLALAAFDDIFSSYQGSEEKIPFPKTDSIMSISFTQPVITEKETRALESLLSFYDRFVQENGNDQELLFDTARAYAKIGLIRQKQGRSTDSVVAYQTAIDFFRKGLLLSEHSEPYKVEMANVFNHFIAESNRQKLQDDYFLGTITEMIDMLSAFPAESPFRNDADEQLYKLLYFRAFIRIHGVAASVLRSGDYRVAQTPRTMTRQIFKVLNDNPVTLHQVNLDLARSRTLLDRLLRQKPDSLDLLVSKAKSDCFCGILLILAGKKDEADHLYNASLALVDKLIQQYPDNPLLISSKTDVLIASTYLIRANPNAKPFDEVKPFLEAKQLIDRLQSDYPLTPHYMVGRILVRYALATIHLNGNDRPGARRYYVEATELMERFRVQFSFFNDFQIFPPLYYHYAEFLIEDKEYERASQLLRKELERGATIKDYPFEDHQWEKRLERLLNSIPQGDKRSVKS